MDLFDVLYVGHAGKPLETADLYDNLYGKKFYDAHSDEITTTTGNPVSIVTNKAQNAISTILSYSPKQSGTGDPSPSNVRPIEGWTEANLTGAGKNMFDKDNADILVNSLINASGDIVSNGSYNCTNNYIKINPNTNYTFSGNFGSLGAYNSVAFYDRDKTFISRYIPPASNVGANFTTPANARFLRFNMGISSVIETIQLEQGSTTTAYEPYTQGANNTISLGGTYYGFSIDVDRGVLRVDTEYFTLDGIDEDWTSSGTGDSKFFRLNIAQTGYRSGVGICDQYNRVSIRTDNTGAGFNLSLTSDYYHFRFRPENVSGMTTGEWKTMLSNKPVHVVIYKDTPLELPLTPQTVALLSGANTIWCDGDEVSVTYKAKKA